MATYIFHIIIMGKCCTSLDSFKIVVAGLCSRVPDCRCKVLLRSKECLVAGALRFEKFTHRDHTVQPTASTTDYCFDDRSG